MSEDWTSSDAERVLGIALFRSAYDEGPGDLPSNGTMGEIAFNDAFRLLRRAPGLRYVLEAGVRAVQSDPLWEPWLMTLYAGGQSDCARAEAAIAATFSPDPGPDPNAMTADQNAMTADQIADEMIRDLHERYPEFLVSSEGER